MVLLRARRARGDKSRRLSRGEVDIRPEPHGHSRGRGCRPHDGRAYRADQGVRVHAQRGPRRHARRDGTYRAHVIEPIGGFSIEVSAAPILMAILGGSRTWVGPILGAVIFQLDLDWPRCVIRQRILERRLLDLPHCRRAAAAGGPHRTREALHAPADTGRGSRHRTEEGDRVMSVASASNLLDVRDVSARSAESMRCAARTCRFARAKSAASSARTAPARPRCSTSLPACRSPYPGRCSLTARSLVGRAPRGHLPARRRAHLSKVRPFPRLTVLQNVMIPIVNRENWTGGIAAARPVALDLIERVGLGRRRTLRRAGSICSIARRLNSLARLVPAAVFSCWTR